MVLRQEQQDKNRFGRNIQFLRKRKKRSQEEVATALEIVVPRYI